MSHREIWPDRVWKESRLKCICRNRIPLLKTTNVSSWSRLHIYSCASMLYRCKCIIIFKHELPHHQMCIVKIKRFISSDYVRELYHYMMWCIVTAMLKPSSKIKTARRLDPVRVQIKVWKVIWILNDAGKEW